MAKPVKVAYVLPSAAVVDDETGILVPPGEAGRRRVIGRLVEKMMGEIKSLYAALLTHSPSRN